MRVSPALSLALVTAQSVPAATLVAQATDPPYLRDFPTVERVKQAMKVNDPKETALRQIGAFWQLQEILKELSGRREYRGFTPAEGKLIGEYGVAEYYAAQGADSAFPGPFGRLPKLSDSTPYRYARTDPRFGVEGIDVFKLLTPAIQAQYDQLAGVDRARVVAKAQADSADRANGGRVVMGQPTQETTGDKEAREIRRCVESGRSESDCLTEGIGKSFRNWIGLPDLTLPKAVGPRLVGTWSGPQKFSVDFIPEVATLHCADLVPLNADYSLALAEGGLRLTLAIENTPVVFMLGPEGRLVGPAGADIKGEIIVGYQQGVRTYSDGRQEPISRPIVNDATRRCAIGALTVASATTAIPSGSSMPATMLNALSGGLDKLSQEVPTGLRLAGEYGSAEGLDVDFRTEGAVVSCGEVGTLRQYSVQQRAGQVVVVVQNGASPFTMTLGADGSLSGSGTVRVDGRRITGKSPNGGFTYAPRSASCELGKLPPAKGGHAGS